MTESESKQKPRFVKYQVGDRIIVPSMLSLGVGVVIGPYEGDPLLVRVKFSSQTALVLEEESLPAPEGKDDRS